MDNENVKVGKRQEWLEEYVSGKVSAVEASERIGVSGRQFRRLVRAYRGRGATGLLHGLAGRPSNRRHADGSRGRILALVRDRYFDCGPTLASELLEEEEGLKVHPETLRLWMRDAGLRGRTRKRRPHRQRRERKECFGQMLQIDGSFHEWFGGRKTCLLNLIDDATSRNLCLFDTQETAQIAVKTLWWWICEHGVPQSIYCDRRSAYLSAELREASGFFGRMCGRLGIALVPAFSAQAKGRIERSNGTHQERLIPRMRLRGIATVEAANEYLRRHYLPRHNAKFAAGTGDFPDVHRRLPPGTRLDDVCHIESPRKVNNDWTVSFEGRTLQIKRRNYCPAKSTVTVRQTISGDITLLYRNEPLEFKELAR